MVVGVVVAVVRGSVHCVAAADVGGRGVAQDIWVHTEEGGRGKVEEERSDFNGRSYAFKDPEICVYGTR